MEDEKLYEVITEHLRNLNKDLTELHKRCKASEWRMKEMDNIQIKYPYYKSMN